MGLVLDLTSESPLVICNSAKHNRLMMVFGLQSNSVLDCFYD